MNQDRWLLRVLRLYPNAWRDRYEQEVVDLASVLMHEKGTGEARIAFGLLLNAPRAWVLHRRGIRGRRALAAGTTAVLVGTALLVSLIVSVNPAASAPFRVTSGAMEPALKVNQVVQVRQLANSAQITPGEILVVRKPPEEDCGGSAARFLVKRVVGLPGETVSISNGYVFVNGEKLKEPWLPSSERGITFTGPTGSAYNLSHPYVVPARSYYLLGDNRVDSCDSRYWGPVPRSLVYGAVVAGN